MINRLDLDYGPARVFAPYATELKAYDAQFRRFGRTWSITIWARNWTEAVEYCAGRGMTLADEIVDVVE